jgi:hypothetical protein
MIYEFMVFVKDWEDYKYSKTTTHLLCENNSMRQADNCDKIAKLALSYKNIDDQLSDMLRLDDDD